MGLLLGHSAWQIDWPSNGSMWNSYSFQLVGPWMGYSFTDLGAEGCCCSLNALLYIYIFSGTLSDLEIITEHFSSVLVYAYNILCLHEYVVCECNFCLCVQRSHYTYPLVIYTSILLCVCSLFLHINGFVQDCSNSIANALGLLQSCAKSSICIVYFCTMSYNSLMPLFIIIWHKIKFVLSYLI